MSNKLLAQTYSFSWSGSLSWTAGSLSNIATNVGGSGINVSASFVNSVAGSYLNTTPAVGNPGGIGWTLPTPTLTGSMVVWVDWADTKQNVTATISFNSPIANPSFYVGDIDKSTAATTSITNYIDMVTVTGTTPTGGTLNATTSKFNAGSTIVVLAGNSAHADPTAGVGGNAPTNAATGAAQDGTVLYSIAGTVSSITIVYSNFNSANTVNPAGQAVNIGNIAFTKTFPVSGNVYNDLNGNGTKDVTETGIRPIPLYVNIVDVSTGNVIGTATVAADGSYTAPNIASNTNVSIQLSNTLGTIGSTPPASATIPNYTNTSPLNISVNTGTAALTNQNFGINHLPESAVNSQVIGVNPGGTVNTVVNPIWFVNSNVGVNPNTQDYDGGSVASIKITAFPTNATSITINGTLYTSATFPVGGVTIPYTAGVGPSQPISIDPVNGIVSCVIPFAAIDNAGIQDPTPGSVTLGYTSILPIKLESFTAALKQGNNVELKWVISEELNVANYEIEFSTDGIHFVGVGKIAATGSRDYNYVHSSSLSGINYYRLKTTDKDGSISYSYIAKVNNSLGKVLSIYPNPAKSNAYVTISNNLINKPAILSLLSIDGKLIWLNKISALSQTEMIPLENIAAGKYILRLKTGDNIISSTISVIK